MWKVAPKSEENTSQTAPRGSETARRKRLGLKAEGGA